MPTNVLMPQMGESVAEGTIVRWIKRVGDAVDKDEPLFEISTDKVDAEIPSPDAGVLLEITVQEGETVPVHSVVAVIGAAGDMERPAFRPAGAAAEPTERPAHMERPAEMERPAQMERPGFSPAGAVFRPAGAVEDVVERRRIRSSPVVRRIAKDRGIDISSLKGSGISGRVTRRDIQALVDRGGAGQASRPHGASRPPAFQPGENVRIEKMSAMRKKIAEHMVMSAQTSPHVYSTFEVDLGRVEELRNRKKHDYEKAGTKLTYTAFIAQATAETIREFPLVNAALDGDNIVYKEDVNLGIAVALDQGLIVPVVRRADRKNMLELCQAIQDLAARARSKQLSVDDVQGGTFTITNPGTFGAVYGFPLINQPQVAILAVGSIEKRPVVVDDQVVVRPVCYLTLGHDHRLIDGADAARFLSALKQRLQEFNEGVV